MIDFLKNIVRILLNQRVPRVENDVIHMLLSRKSCRDFCDREVTREQLDTVLKVGINSPSTVNLQTWSFFPFLSDEWKNKFGAPIPFGAKAAIIIAADLKRLDIIDKTYQEFPLFFYTLAVMNASLAAMNMTVAVEAMGMKSIMLSQTGRTGLVDYHYLKERLSLPDKVFPLTTLAFGYPKRELIFSPPKLKSHVTVHKDCYHLDEQAVGDWYSQMQTACLVAEREKLAEKFDKYVKLLPDAEKDLWNGFRKIKD